MELTIKRSEWLRGEGSDDSYLLRESDEKKCCLGFFALACGYNDEEILGRDTPISLIGLGRAYHPRPDFLPLFFQAFGDGVYQHGKVTERLMTINDDKEYGDHIREELIIQKFAEIGVKVTFVD